MKIGLISDTHIPTRAREIPKDFLDFFKENNVDLIIHCGDIEDKKVLDELNKIAETKAVLGNIDYLDLPEKLIFNIENYKVLVFHSDIIYPRGDKDKLVEFAKLNNANVVIFGHTHIPLFTYYRGVYLINPGTATGVRSGETKDVVKSVAILEIKDKLNVKFLVI